MSKTLPLKLAILLSGSGTTLANLIDQIRSNELSATICGVIGSRDNLKGLDRAQVAGLPTLVIDPREFSPAEFNEKIFSAIDLMQIDLICLAGWLCLLQVPSRYEGKIINIHPSLLPSFGGKGMYGMKVHQAVLDRGCRVSGCTVHFVDNQYDHGPILLQRICPVQPDDTAATLAARVFEQEKIAYPQAIRMIQQKIKGDPSLSPSEIRRDYQVGALKETDVASDPIEQFRTWFSDASQAGISEINAMTLATADAAGKPSARIVLLKGFDSVGFVFYTNRTSQKGRELAENPSAALVLFWEKLERQVRISGRVEPLTREQSEPYFHSRPRASQIGAWVSHQSSVVSSREELARIESDLKQKFGEGEIPMPDFWGGYRVIPEEIEFWQGRPSRLHDRLRYRKVDSSWKIERLAP